VQVGWIQVIQRRWYGVLLGLIVTALAARVAVSDHGVYYSQADVVLLPPEGINTPNIFATTNTSGPVNMAGIIGRIMAQHAAPQPVSDQVTILGEGIRDGYIVRQPNDGGQWEIQFKRPILDVQVAGDSPATVKATLDRVVAEIETDLRNLQISAGTARDNMIQARLSPPVPSVFYVKGSAARAGLATLVLGLGLSLAGARALDRVLVSRHREWWLRRRRTTRESASEGGVSQGLL
jgi:hypothetical protein